MGASSSSPQRLARSTALARSGLRSSNSRRARPSRLAPAAELPLDERSRLQIAAIGGKLIARLLPAADQRLVRQPYRRALRRARSRQPAAAPRQRHRPGCARDSPSAKLASGAARPTGAWSPTPDTVVSARNTRGNAACAATGRLRHDLVGTLGDGALEASQRLIARMRERGCAARLRVLVKLVEGEREQRQRARRGSGILRQDRIEPEPRFAGATSNDNPAACAGLRIISASSAGDAAARSMRPVPRPAAIELGNSCGAMPESARMVAIDPHRPRARQAGEQSDKQPPVLGADSRNREQFLELIDDKNELGVLEGEEPARLTLGLGQTRRARWRTENPARYRANASRAGLHPARARSTRPVRRPAQPARVSAFAKPRMTSAPLAARPEHDAAQKCHAADALRLHQSRHDAGLHQRRFARAARPRHQQKGAPGARIGGKLLGRLHHRRVAAEEDRRMLELVGFEPAERGAEPDRCARSRRHAEALMRRSISLRSDSSSRCANSSSVRYSS